MDLGSTLVAYAPVLLERLGDDVLQFSGEVGIPFAHANGRQVQDGGADVRGRVSGECPLAGRHFI